MARRNFSKKTLVERFKFCGGKCEACGAVLKLGGWHGDHDNPDGLTGTPTFENCKVLCIPCHAEKTKKDVETIAKAKRVEAKHIGATAPKQKIASRGFPKREKLEKLPLPPRRGLFQ